MPVAVRPVFYEEGCFGGSQTKQKRIIQNKRIYLVDREHMNGQKYIDECLTREDGKLLKKIIHVDSDIHISLMPGKYYFFVSKKDIPDYKKILNGKMCAEIEVTDQLGQEIILPWPMCYHTSDGAEEVAKYIIDEIKQNSTENSLTTGMINAFNQAGQLLVNQSYPLLLKAIAYASWTDKVWPGNDWDHKPDISGRRGNLGLENHSVYRPLEEGGNYYNQFYHKYKEYDYYYDVWSNIHFGYIGKAAGFSDAELLDGAGLAQWIDDLRKSGNPQIHDETARGFRKRDDIPDQRTIELGIKLFEETKGIPARLTPFSILSKLEKLGNEGLLKGNRVKHICFDDYDFTPA